MKTLALAFGSSLATSILFYVIFTASGLGENALHVALIPLLGTSHLYELMEKRQAKRDLPMSPKSIFTFEGFAIPWYAMIVYGTFIYLGLAQVTSGVGGIMTHFMTDVSDAIRASRLVQIPILVLAVYLLGFWIGSRCAAHGLIATILAVYLGQTLGKLLDFVVTSESITEILGGGYKDLWVGILLGASIFAVPTILGFWSGSRIRMSKYLQYLLAVLPPETQTTIVNLAYEEAQTSTAKRVHC
jgi:hypothetical protein